MSKRSGYLLCVAIGAAGVLLCGLFPNAYVGYGLGMLVGFVSSWIGMEGAE